MRELDQGAIVQARQRYLRQQRADEREKHVPLRIPRISLCPEKCDCAAAGDVIAAMPSARTAAVSVKERVITLSFPGGAASLSASPQRPLGKIRRLRPIRKKRL